MLVQQSTLKAKRPRYIYVAGTKNNSKIARHPDRGIEGSDTILNQRRTTMTVFVIIVGLFLLTAAAISEAVELLKWLEERERRHKCE